MIFCLLFLSNYIFPSRIKEYNDSYTATEKLIAEYILENDILQDSAQALGEKTNTSAAAIIRFSTY